MDVHGMGRRVIREAVHQEYREVHDMYQDNNNTELSTEEYDMVKSKAFNFHSTWLIIFPNLKQKLFKELIRWI